MIKTLKHLIIAGVCLCAALPVPSLAVADDAPMDPALQQQVTAGEPIASHGTKITLSAGHADLGPVVVDGQLILMLRDDSAEPPTWRYLDDVTLLLDDTASQTVTDGYTFTGASVGDKVWVIPQTEIEGVPWLGWNTQHPSITSDATFIRGEDTGDGQLTVFLQNGGFGPPQVLGPEIFAAQGTHAHANWVFTVPGTHTIPLAVRVGDEVTVPVPLTVEIDSALAPPTHSEISSWLSVSNAALALAIAALIFLVAVAWYALRLTTTTRRKDTEASVDASHKEDLQK